MHRFAGNGRPARQVHGSITSPMQPYPRHDEKLMQWGALLSVACRQGVDRGQQRGASSAAPPENPKGHSQRPSSMLQFLHHAEAATAAAPGVGQPALQRPGAGVRLGAADGSKLAGRWSGQAAQGSLTPSWCNPLHRVWSSLPAQHHRWLRPCTRHMPLPPRGARPL